ncbi:hypothetical protein BH24DEI2_BH24DEI2_03430 [soil metagenome]
MTNAVYQATVAALEALLPPRVVSRTLQEGLQAVAKTPSTLQVDDVDKILKQQVYRQLQVVMPVTEAKQKLQDVLESIKKIKVNATVTLTMPVSQADVEELRASLRPFNLYFEWPEVQKLRAQVQLLEAEQQAGREAGRLLEEARQGLATVEQKLTDQLVYQAKSLGELTAALELVRFLGGPKVRRLENYLGQIETAQDARSLAPAEVERAHKLVADLRKLMESSVAVEPAATADAGLIEVDSEGDDLLSLGSDTPAPGGAGVAASAKLLQLDLDDERRSLDKLRSDCADLLTYRPALADELNACVTQLASGVSTAEHLETLRSSLVAAARAERAELSAEFTKLQNEVVNWDAETTSELAQHLQVTLSVLNSTLPPARDVQHLRSLYHLAASQNRPAAAGLDEHERLRNAEREKRLAEQLGELHKIEEMVSGYGNVALDELQTLNARLQETRASLEQDEPVNTFDDLWVLLDAVQKRLEQRSADFATRLDTALLTYEEVVKLNSEEVFKVGTLLQHLNGQRDAMQRVSAGVRAELVDTLTQAETQLNELQSQYHATRAVADQLAGSDVMGGLFGLFDAFPSFETPLSSAAVTLDGWTATCLQEPGVRHLALYDETGRVVSGALPSGAADPYAALVKLDGSATELGTELTLGAPRATVVELAEATFLTAALASGHRLVAQVEPDRAEEMLPTLQAKLGELRDLLVRS